MTYLKLNSKLMISKCLKRLKSSINQIEAIKEEIYQTKKDSNSGNRIRYIDLLKVFSKLQ